MTLQLSVYYRDEITGEEKSVPLESDVFGLEVARKELWGQPILRQLGLEILPELGEGAWLNIGGEELDQLEREANLILENTGTILEHTNYTDGRLTGGKTIVEEYATNLLEAVKKARAVNGYVSV